MSFASLLVVLLLQPPVAQEPRRVDATKPSAVTPEYRAPKPGESVMEGLLQRVECPHNRPVVFTMRVKQAVERFEAPRLGDVEYIAHTPTFKGPMTCGGRGKGDRVRLTWTKAARTRRVVAIEFLPAK